MPDQKKAKKPGKGKSSAEGVLLDVVFGGPLLFVPAVTDNNVTGVEVYSPCNGHPVGAVFLPGVWFSDAELQDPKCERWPEPESFSLLDSHSYTIDLKQELARKGNDGAFPVSSIPDTNHKIRPGRKLSHEWSIHIAVNGQMSNWTSPCLADVKPGLFHGSDSPTTSKVALTHRLTYTGVTGAEFCGVSTEAKEYLKANISKGGTLIVLGELPYHSTLAHERQAIDALAKLAGLDLRLLATTPTPKATKVMSHVDPCYHSIVVA
ncbi:hypothetical protein [Acidicapsa acidisoli]|uniref:hypothetical protein n=1 Tax=Acidicapsa acidisoli TaxID=1615681 RepID=UPI0021E0223D|nr:hypothetical protein [Acidicapsa acidisoli]